VVELALSLLYVCLHPQDNVAIVVNDSGLPEGTVFADGLVLRERAPQGREQFRLMPDVANGRETCAEHLKLHNALTLFNPAPVT
jgi:galactarate dehydratase